MSALTQNFNLKCRKSIFFNKQIESGDNCYN